MLNMNESFLEKEAGIYKALAHPVRLEILKLLTPKNLGVDKLSKLLSKRQPNISQHLQILKKVGLVFPTKVGKRRIYQIDVRWALFLNRYLGTSNKFLSLFSPLNLNKILTP